MTEAEALDAALDIRRGLRKLRDLSEEDRRVVTGVLYRTPEVELAQRARQQEVPRSQAKFTYRRNLRAL